MSRLSEATRLAAFDTQPALYCTPTTAASLLGHGISTALAERMLGLPHCRERLNIALRERMGDCPTELTAAQSGLAMLDPAGLTRFALRAGAAWHAAWIAKAFDGPTVRTLVERIGPEFRDVALADLAARSGVDLAEPDLAITTEDLPAAIARDGTACLVAWCEQQPQPVGWRVLLRIRMNTRPGPRHVEAGPPLIERLATSGKSTLP